MSGTMAGGLKAAQKNLAKDPDFYKKIGQRGGSVTGRKGFAVSGLARIAGAKGGHATGPKGFAVSGLARIAGAKGGRKSRRDGIKNGEGQRYINQGEV